MIKKIPLLAVCLGCLVSAFGQKIQSPSVFLGYELGTRFTYQYRVTEYFKYVASVSKNVKLVQYGTTNEDRPLVAAFIASDANIDRLEEIRKNNIGLAGLAENKALGNGFMQTATNPATVTANTPVIVWLSYNVHGNEPSSSEAAMLTLFDMVDPDNAKTKTWLANTVVVIDPCLNPDGHERYVNFYNSVKGAVPDPDPAAREHAEPWPGGRVNHYYFDLNRDWAWQTQKESKARVGLYNSWLPQVHVDFHEQGYNAPYYFAPAAEPFHRDITPWQKEFQTTIGKNNAKYFDQNGWLYFTKEEFDLLYPSYGDTYPIYNGSIGMTYEQGGIGAGLAITTRTGDVLTLKDRIAHHHSNSLSTIETASANAAKAVTEFKKYFDNSRTNPTGEYKGYVIKNDNDDKMQSLTELLRRNGIQYKFGIKTSATGYNYFSGKTERFDIDTRDITISAYQPKSVLLNVLLEPKTFVADSNTYDITAWSLPYVYGLRAYGLKEAIKPAAVPIVDVVLTPPLATQPTAHAYAYVAAWQSVTSVQFLSGLLQKNVKVRYAEAPFEAAGKKFGAGSLIITKAGNADAGFDAVVRGAADNAGIELTPLTTGFVDKGVDLGSASVHFIHPPKVMLMSGEGVSSEAMGEIWEYFEQQIGYPVTLINYNNLGRAKLGDFDVIIFPDGNYQDFPSDDLQNWVKAGGKLIALQGAVSQLAGKKGFDIKRRDADTLKNKPSLKIFGNRNRDNIKSTVPGAIYKINLDNTHPLGFGYPNYYYTLKLTDDIYALLDDGDWNVGTVKKDGYVAGFVGQKGKEKIRDGLLLGIQPMGRGSVVYLVDDPLFRSFWENGKLLFGNAVFMVQ
ncbi:M14 family metallopeptidase [Mucilaginibacter sp. UR6-11]|uniref:M14 family metallopeptidase n=1 Tax=Mucilaginibacter sp. UR6-11 TaxID=1435644 RepID=UPI001E2F8064|nr:M14 family metallopeptidase [Mucilaginibacter sp. UR6-11]MCC8424404.1 M14 family metallopeptidase [Mucilaginibacter sp. UR6-11]